MNNSKLDRQIKRIQSLVSKANNAFNGDLEMQAHWAKYLCVLVAGLLENAIKELYSDYARRQVSAPIANFVTSQLSQIRNPKAEKFISTAKAFKDSMGNDLENYIQSSGRGEAINSIMNNRHQIAHGDETNVGLSLAQLRDYFHKSVEVLKFIEGQCSSQ